MATNNEAILEEIEALQAIMLDEVTVLQGESGVPNGVEVSVVPATAQNIDEQHVRVTLVLTLPPEYPDVPPNIILRNPRGVDDYVLMKIQKESKQKCEEFLGCPVIYELIEVVRDNLTANNAPSCPCAICLHHFTDTDVFTKTLCFHYFHSYCLGRYIASCEDEAAAEEEEPQPAWMAREKKPIMCPVCRDPLQKELSSAELLMCLPPEEDKTVAEFRADDPDIMALQQRMARLYMEQKEKGGIIDLEEEKNKFLLSSNRVESCEGLDEGSNGDMAGTKTLDSSSDLPHEELPVTPPHTKRGGRLGQQHKPHSQKASCGGHGRHQWRNNDPSGDSRYWAGNRGGRGGGNGRGRGGRPNYHGHSRIISEPHDYNSYSSDYKSSQVIDNGYGHSKRDLSHENGYYNSGDNRSGGIDMSNGAGGMGRKGPRGPGGRQRYPPGRGRGRGPPPPGFAPSAYRHSAQDLS
ncbi:E3 ubiquitin-protein ligase RNF25 [Macrobrachium rosenbergii]|uniref:E3 ubiquitin-protein ligase RNF25 n=1 Tax=Macrobrachium rosenbergii TaxID=79674 RepID=UPI0034D3BBD4